MKHIPKNIEGDENVNKVHPFKELCLYFSAILLILVLSYQALGYLVHFFIENLDHKNVMGIHHYIDSKTKHSEMNIIKNKKKILSNQEMKVQIVLKRILSHTNYKYDDFKISIIKGKAENALAYPGGSIIIVDSLLENIKSENELAFVIAHEIGHFHHRHILKNFGRSLITIGFSILLSSVESNVSDQMIGFLNISNLSYSRDQEIESDKFALIVLNEIYGHVNGSENFFIRTKGKESILSTTYLSTHPLAKERVSRLKEYSKGKGFEQNGDLIPWRL